MKILLIVTALLASFLFGGIAELHHYQHGCEMLGTSTGVRWYECDIQ